MFDAIGLYHFGWRKKKAEFYIIPPSYFINGTEVETEKANEAHKDQQNLNAQTKTSAALDTQTTELEVVQEFGQVAAKNPIDNETTEPQSAILNPRQSVNTGVSAFSLASIKAKKALEESNKNLVKEVLYLPTEAFTETEMLIYWGKYAQRLGDKGHRIMEALLQINKPRLDGTTILHELPNEGSKLDFEREKIELLGYLRGKLHNHDLTINVVVNETMKSKKSFTDQDRYNRLHEINPTIELLKSTFGLDLD